VGLSGGRWVAWTRTLESQLKGGFMKKLIAGVLAVAITGGVAYAFTGESRVPVLFYEGHTHDENGHAHDAPEHSGGLDKAGCHNGSVPYHCH
jgi:hypothetical protein